MQDLTPLASRADAAAPAVSALLTDLYQLTMAQAYFDQRMSGQATFSLFARHLPAGWGYFVAAGLDDALSYLESFALTTPELAYLEQTGLFSAPFLTQLARLRFTGSVRAMPEGTVCFPHEPLIEVTAPIAEAQLVETYVLNQIHFQTIIASKAARCIEAAAGRRLVDFGLRRTHGADAGLKAARASYLTGFDSTSNVLAGQRYGIPISGTMAHSFIQAFDDELAAFRAYAGSFPASCVLLVDTYDTLEGTRRAALVGQELAAAGHTLRGVRLDSGDLIALSFKARAILDQAGLRQASIFASGGLDEHEIAAMVARGAPIDGFGVGSRLGTSADAPYLDMAYKLVEYDRRPVLKLSAAKATWPGPKQVWRAAGPDGSLEDWLTLADETAPAPAEPLLAPAMTGGRRTSAEPLGVARDRARERVAALPAAYCRLDAQEPPAPRISQRLQQLRDRLAQQAGQARPGDTER